MGTFTLQCATLWMTFLNVFCFFNKKKTGFLKWAYYSPNHFPSDCAA